MIVQVQSALTKYLQRYEGVYPGIIIWWERRVVVDVELGVKQIFRFDRDFDVQALGVVDLVQGKLCHLSLEHAVRGSGLGRSILNLAKRALVDFGHDELWCHGPEGIADSFCRWSGAIPGQVLGNFGRTGEKDVMMVMSIKEMKGK